MTAAREVTTTGQGTPQQAPARELVLRPAVDSFENAHEIHLLVNLPGVPEEGLDIEVDDRTLTLEGEIRVETPAELASLHAEVRSTRYRRAFTLSSELDTAQIRASIKDGLLTLIIPKREEVRPRKIDIAAG